MPPEYCNKTTQNSVRVCARLFLRRNHPHTPTRVFGETRTLLCVRGCVYRSPAHTCIYTQNPRLNTCCQNSQNHYPQRVSPQHPKNTHAPWVSRSLPQCPKTSYWCNFAPCHPFYMMHKKRKDETRLHPSLRAILTVLPTSNGVCGVTRMTPDTSSVDRMPHMTF